MSHAYLYSPQEPENAVELKEFLTIGSDVQNQLVLSSDQVADRHARIEMMRGQYLVRDMHSTGGTFVNGMQILQSYLRPGDEVSFGNEHWIFSDVPPFIAARLKSKNEKWDLKLRALPQIAQTDFPVLLLGPSGSGKEVLSKFLHHNSKRRAAPFVTVNCSAFTETLAESEFFGHIKGSFTGAFADRKGAFEAARGGTLFLDEVGDLPPNLQAKLLRVLENHEIRPVGSDRTLTTNVRILAATHHDLANRILEGKFRRDLYHRLGAIPIHVPALRDRIEDFEDILFSFAKQFRIRFSHDAIQSLKERSWPGNIRELRNVVARAKAYHDGQTVRPEHLGGLVESSPHDETISRPHAPAGISSLPIMKELERQVITQRLAANHGNQRRTAIELGMPKSTLHDRIKLYQIHLQDFAG